MLEIMYLLRNDDNGYWTLTKWEDGERPVAIYRIHLGTENKTCSCPSGSTRGYCKHIDMVKTMIDKQVDIATVKL